MSNNKGYNDGWQDGYWFGSGDAYSRGYEEGKQAERDRIKRAVGGSNSLPTSESSALGPMVGGSIILTIFGWGFVGIIQFLGWIGGQSESWWFPWIWKIAFWAGVGFIMMMSIGGVIMAIMEEYETKHPSEKSTNNLNSPPNRIDSSDLWKKKYPLGNAKDIKEAEIVSNQDK